MTMLQFLEMIQGNCVPSRTKEEAFNLRTKEALAAGYITQNHKRKIAYSLTEKGKVFLSVAKTGVPWPEKMRA